MNGNGENVRPVGDVDQQLIDWLDSLDPVPGWVQPGVYRLVAAGLATVESDLVGDDVRLTDAGRRLATRHRLARPVEPGVAAVVAGQQSKQRGSR